VEGTELGQARYAAAIARLREDAPAYAAADEARKAMGKGQLEEAEGLVRKAIALQGREPTFYGLLGDLQRKQRDWDDAITSYDAAIARDPEYFAYYLGRGLARKNHGERALARDDFDRSVKLLPTAIAYNELGRMAEADGNVDQALRLFSAAGKSDSPAGQAARASAMRIDLPRNPSRYLKARVERDARGRLLLGINNPTGVAVGDVTVRIETLDKQGRTREGTRRFARLDPGATEWVVLMQDATALSDARAGVVAARILQ
jgi:tetratricopeptide (TPR) repeat protein